MPPPFPTSFVLYVEDNPDDVLLLKRLAAKAGIGPLQYVEGGQEAKRLLSRTPPPSVIITDLRMPKGGGKELIAWIRTQPALKGIPIILLSGIDGGEGNEEAETSGADYYIRKPSELSGYEPLWELLRCFSPEKTAS